MKRLFTAVLLFFIACPLGAWAADDVAALLAEADQLTARAIEDCTRPDNQTDFFKAMELSARAAELAPQSFEANWKAARGCRLYVQQVKWDLKDGWEKLSAEYGKKGMLFAEKAIELEPERVEGHFWYGCCVGAYADGVSIVTALKEGIKDKTQSSFETAASIDESYWYYCSVLSLGEFWTLLPWPLAKKDKARDYLEDYLKKAPADAPNYIEGQLHLGNILAHSKGKDKARGKEILDKVAADRLPYYCDLAKATLKKKF